MCGSGAGNTPKCDKRADDKLDDTRLDTSFEATCAGLFAHKGVVKQPFDVFQEEIIGLVILSIAEHVDRHRRPREIQ